MLTRRRCCCGTSCQLCVTVTNCSGTALSGATVTITQGGTTIGTCTTNGSGQCCVDVPSSGSYVAAVTLSGYTGSNKVVSVTCPAGASATLVATPDANRHRFFAQSPCDLAGIPGVVFTIDGGSYTTDASGFAYYAIPAGTYSWTATSPHPGLNNASGSKVHFSCFTSNWGQLFTVATGYACICGCKFPISKSASLSLTDSIIGSVSLTWDAGTSTFKGTIAGYGFPGFCGCAAKTTDVEYEFGGAAASCGLSVRFKARPAVVGNCPDDSTGWAWHNPSLSYTTTIVDCTDNLEVTNVPTYFCVCNTPPVSCTVTDMERSRLWGGSIPTITVTQ